MYSPAQQDKAKAYLLRIQNLALTRPFRIMNVCGGHERSITQAGLRTLLPEEIELIPGPGCPVCICPPEDICLAIRLAMHEDITLVAFGDMLRVPIHVHDQPRSLMEAKAAGGRIIPIANPQEAVTLAHNQPQTRVIFFVAGFETTLAPVAAMLAQGVPANLSLLMAGRLTWPAVAMLLQTGQANFDALIAPGHVATVMGAKEWDFVAKHYHIPCAVAGFTPDTLLQALYSVLTQLLQPDADTFVDNCYPEVVRQQGNPHARNLLAQMFVCEDANWRGVGKIKQSGLFLQKKYANHDARLLYPQHVKATQSLALTMPPGCACAKVLLGQCYPNACQLYGKACTPRHPVGPCMVSEEGACRIWWASGVKPQNDTAK